MTNINLINPNSFLVKGVSFFKNPDATLPTALIEACCTTGRTRQAYKRGGKLEATERFREELTSAVFWLWGVKGLNKLGDIFGEKVLKLKGFNTDVGKDALRDPSYNISSAVKCFKLGKIVASVLIGTALMGFAVPKINHAITAKLMKNRKNEPNEKEKSTNNSMDNFINSSSKVQNKYLKNPNTSFKGGLMEGAMRAAHNLENNNIWRLVSTDAGMVVGRVKNSRHKVEAAEYAYRDILSCFFYNFSTGLVINLLNKKAGTKDTHPKAMQMIGEYLSNTLGDKNLAPEDFLKLATDKNSTLSNLNIKYTKDDTILAKDLIRQLKENGIDRHNNKNLIKKAIEMSGLQPKYHGEKILSKQQVEDVFSNAITSDPKFLKETINAATQERALDPTKFVERKVVEGARQKIDDFCSYVAKCAKEKGKNVDADFIKEMTSKSLKKTALYQFLGMAISAVGLAIIVPKTQQFLSQKIFGNTSFEEIANGDSEHNKKAAQ